MAKYYKVTNEKENHNGFQYQDGLNILREKFNDDETQSCVPGGFYFTTKEHIDRFYDFGVHIREVELPTSDPEFRMVKDPEDDKWRANMIVLEKKYSIADPSTYNDLKIMPPDMDDASMHGYLGILNWWMESKYELEYSEDAMDGASEMGHVHVLQWWKDSGIKLKYSARAIDLASENGHIDVLRWWVESGLELLYSLSAINRASESGHIDVLEWWENSGLELLYSEEAIDWASYRGHIGVLEWWRNSGLPLKFECAIYWASAGDQPDVLEWWSENWSQLEKKLNQ